MIEPGRREKGVHEPGRREKGVHEPLFVLSQDDWSLHRKGEMDQQRHLRKVKEAIKNNLADLVSDEAIITSQGDKVLKVPVRSLDEPRFRYDQEGKNRVGQGWGGTQVGDVIGRAGPDGEAAAGPGKGREAGDQPGVDYYEAEITVDELAELVFEDLQLPRLAPKSAPELDAEDVRFNDVRRKGMMGNVDKRRTLIEAMRRQALSGGAGGGGAGGSGGGAGGSGGGPGGGVVGDGGTFAGGGGAAALAGGAASAGAASSASPAPAPVVIRNEDMRFKTWEDVRKPQSAAVVLAMMDTSGSMGSFEKYIARSFFFWMVRFLRTKYERVPVVFLAHDTAAKQVEEEAFFTKGESGGTMCSSVYKLALEVLETSYPEKLYNAYAFHFSDGDNFDADNAATADGARKLLERTNLLGYGEIRRYAQGGRLWDTLSGIEHERFSRSVLQDKADVFRTLKAFFGEEIG